MVKIIGDVFDLVRVQTGIKTLDRAFENQRGEIGIPLTTVELFGPTGCGKSTLSWFLAQLVSKAQDSTFALMAVEQFDPKYFVDAMDFYQYDGSVFLAQGDSDENRMDSMIQALRKNNPSAYVLDSIGAISPIAENEGKSGEANMGRRAKLTAVHIRKVCHYILDNGGILAIFINHVHPNLGFVGTDTPGGKTLKYMSAIRVKIKKKETFPEGSFVIEGTVIKNRFGYEKRVFYTWVLGGRGIHLGMSAFWDCVQLGLLVKPKGARTYQWADSGEKDQTLPSLVNLAREGNTEVFQPYYLALDKADGVIETKDEISEDE